MLAEADSLWPTEIIMRCGLMGGVAPVTRQSGKRKQVIMRYACNQRLRNAFYHWARVSLQNDDRSRHGLRKKGHSHGRALRGVADVMLVSMLRSGTSYDPQLRSPNQLAAEPLAS
jgi:hypothetical protein